MDIRSPCDTYTMQECLSSQDNIRVYKCRSQRFATPVCLKIIAKKNLDNAQQITTEIDILQHVKHPGIIQFIETFEDASCYVIAYDFFEGYTLTNAVQAVHRFPEERARRIFKQIVDVVLYLHGNKIAHRNLSTNNILINANDQIKILDFAYATDTCLESIKCPKVAPNIFDPPEVLMDKPAVGTLCDSWALGIILYYMMVGRLPYNGESRHDIYVSINSGGVMRPNELPVAAHNLILKLLEIDCLRRYSPSMILNHYWVSEAMMNPKGPKQILLSCRTVMTGHRESCGNIRQKAVLRNIVNTTRSFSQENSEEENEANEYKSLPLNSSAVLCGSHPLPKIYPSSLAPE